MSTKSVEDFLNAEFFKKVSEKRLKHGNFDLKSVKVASAGTEGEGYCGQIYRGVVKLVENGKELEHDYIIKVSAGDNNQAAAIAEGFNAFKTEISMYGSYLPPLQAISGVKLAPTCYELASKPYELLVLENLKPYGFRGGPKEGFDLTHSLLVIRQMARFHASSATYFEANGLRDEHIKTTGMYSQGIEGRPWATFINNLFLTFRRVLETTPELQRELKEISALGDNLAKHLTAATNEALGGFQVLNHGDLWNFNILFIYEGEKPVDVIFIDYQLSAYGTFAQDFMFFLATSVRRSERSLQYDQLVEVYHSELERSLKAMNYPRKIPTLKDIHRELLQKSLLAIGALVESYAVIELGEAMDFAKVLENSQGGEEYRKKFFQNERFMETARDFLPFLRQRGMLDPIETAF